MMAAAIRVLIIEDSEPDAELVLRELRQGGYSPKYEIVDTPEAMAAALDKPWDVIISDYVMPHFSGMDALRMVQEKGLDIPFIMVSGKIGEDVATTTMLAGAKDYVLKSNLSRLAPATRREIIDTRRRQRADKARKRAEEALREAYDEQERRIAERTQELLKANWLLGNEIAERRRVEAALSESEERYRTLYDAIDEGFCIIQMIFDEKDKPIDYRFLEVNPAFERQTGLIDARGRRMRELEPEHEEHWFEIYGRIALTGQPARFENRAEQLHRWYDVHAFRFGQPENRQVAILFDDITERKETEDALRESEERFRVMADSSPVVLWVTDAEGGDRFVNRTFSEFFGATLDQVEGSKWQPLVHPDDAPEYVGELMRSVREHTRFSGEARLRRADGEWRWLAAYAHPRFSESGEFLGHVGISLDITERKRAEMELAAARAEVERRAAEFRSFIIGIADGVAMWDADRQMIFINDAGRHILGMPADVPLETLGRTYEVRTIEGEPIPEEQWGSRRALRGEQVNDFRARIVTPWKETVVSYSAAPVLDAAGQVIGATSVLRDIGERVELERQKEELYDREHTIAHMLQSALVPPATSIDIEGCRAALKYEPALREAEVGGDFYDVFQLSDGKVGVVIGDVAGKGLAAAVYVAAAKHAIRSYAYLFDSPAEVMTHVNDALCKTELGGHVETSMLTAFFVVVDAHAGAMTYANAGHEPPVIRHADGSTEELGETSIALGIAPGRDYTESTHRLGPDDIVVMVTDGITEARPSGAFLFGKDGVLRYLSENPQVPFNDIPSGLLEAARAHGGGRLQDDVAIVAFQCSIEH